MAQTKLLGTPAIRANISNTLWSVSDVLLYPAVYLLFTPLLLAHLGKDGYGLFILVNTLVVFMQVFNFGLGVNTLKNLSALIGRSRNTEIVPLLQINLSISLVIAGVCMVFAFLFGQLTHHFHWFAIPDRLGSTALFAICISGVIGGQKITEQVLTNALIAFEKIGVVARYNSAIRIVNLLMSLLLISRGISLVVVFLTTMLLYAGGLLFLYRMLIRQSGALPFAFRLDRKLIGQELRYSKWIWIQSVLVIFAFQFDKFLIGYWFGINNFSYYSIVSTIFNHLHLALIALAPWAMPQIAKQFSAGEDVRDYYINCRSLIHMVAFCGILLFSFFHELVFRLWLGPDMLAHIDDYIHLFLCFELLLSFTIAPYFFLNATGQERLATLNTAIYTLLFLGGLCGGYLLFHSMKGVMASSSALLFVAVIVQQWMIGSALAAKRVRETLGLLLPVVSLIAFVLSEGWSLPLRAVLLALSISSFVYVYFVLYPFRLTRLQASKNPGNE